MRVGRNTSSCRGPPSGAPEVVDEEGAEECGECEQAHGHDLRRAHSTYTIKPVVKTWHSTVVAIQIPRVQAWMLCQALRLLGREMKKDLPER